MFVRATRIFLSSVLLIIAGFGYYLIWDRYRYMKYDSSFYIDPRGWMIAVCIINPLYIISIGLDVFFKGRYFLFLFTSFFLWCISSIMIVYGMLMLSNESDYLRSEYRYFWILAVCYEIIGGLHFIFMGPLILYEKIDNVYVLRV